MRLTLDDIYTFSLCPKYYRDLKSYVLPRSKKLSIITKIVKRAYSRRTEYDKKSEWKSVLGWVDKEVFKNVDIDNEESFFAARKLSEDILVFVRKWYEQDYIRNDAPSYIDIPVSYDFESNIVLGKIPILQLSNPPLITYIDELDYDNIKIYNDIRVMSWACILLEELDIEEIQVRHLFIGPKSGFSMDPAIIKSKKCKKIRGYVNQIANSIAVGVSYPSYTDMCYSCPLRRGCRL